MAHLAGVLHRDLKPSNILFDGEGVPKITDFGLAKRLGPEEAVRGKAMKPLTGQVLGTPSYMRARTGRGAGSRRGSARRPTLYALGAILYEMLTGLPPFKGRTSKETLKLVLTEEIIPPSRRLKIPRDLETICLKCLVREPQKRYASAAGLADDLDRYLNREPVRARRTPPWERGLEVLRRHPTTMVLSALSLAAIVAVVVVRVKAERAAQFAAKLDEARLAQLRLEVEKALFEAQKALAERHWDEARLLITQQLSPDRG